jgi:hypothetical protein
MKDHASVKQKGLPLESLIIVVKQRHSYAERLIVPVDHIISEYTIELSVDPDAMIANIRLAPSPDIEITNSIYLAADEIDVFLENSGIAYGIDDSVIARIASERIFNEWITVAYGKQPVPGVDGTITLLFSIDDSERRIKEDKQGLVNLRELNLIQNVTKGDHLCDIQPALRGKPGINVYGKAVLTKDGKPARIPKGENVVPSEDGSKLLAAMDGMVIWDGVNVHVKPVYLVDVVDASVGNIHFNGTVVVNGEVGEGYEIHAGQDIIIAMSVGPVVLEAKGNVRINGGILGSQKGFIKAGGDVELKFIQDAEVSAAGAIIVDEYIRGGQVSAIGPLIVKNPHGGITASTVSSETWIYAHTIGNEHAPAPVRLIVGHDPGLPKKKDGHVEDMYTSVKDFIKLYSSLIKLRRLKEKYALSKDHETLYAKILSAMNRLKTHMLAADDEIANITEKIQRVYGGFIYVEGTVYEGTSIQIGHDTLSINSPKTATQFSLVNGKLTEAPYTVKPEIKTFLSKDYHGAL